jgi:phosphatidylglycerol:prolipoprotein diacylglycerol transferase
MPWADVAVPSLAGGLFITRIGCYLYGCDFGKRLSDHAPALLRKMGTFPKLPEGTLGYAENGLPIIGSPAYARHLSLCQDHAFSANDCRDLHASLPVHPTQIYESLIGLGLLGLLLWMRKRQVFRGQLFFVFTFVYGVLRFLLELLRDDQERGDIGPALGEHWLIAGSLMLFAVGFAYGPALSFSNKTIVKIGSFDLTRRTAARLLAFVPGIVAFIVMRPASFGEIQVSKLSTSQFVGLFSAVAVCFFYARYWLEAQRAPELAMSLGLPEEEAKPKKKKKKKKAAKPAPAQIEEKIEDKVAEKSDEEPAPEEA